MTPDASFPGSIWLDLLGLIDAILVLEVLDLQVELVIVIELYLLGVAFSLLLGLRLQRVCLVWRFCLTILCLGYRPGLEAFLTSDSC